jgi:hypothetical protein
VRTEVFFIFLSLLLAAKILETDRLAETQRRVLRSAMLSKLVMEEKTQRHDPNPILSARGEKVFLDTTCSENCTR